MIRSLGDGVAEGMALLELQLQELQAERNNLTHELDNAQVRVRRKEAEIDIVQKKLAAAETARNALWDSEGLDPKRRSERISAVRDLARIERDRRRERGSEDAGKEG